MSNLLQNLYEQMNRYDGDLTGLAQYLDMSVAEAEAFIEDMNTNHLKLTRINVISSSQIRLSKIAWSLKVDPNPTPPRSRYIQHDATGV